MKKIIALMLFLTFFAHANDSEPGSQYLKAAEAGDRRAQYFLADSWFSSGDLSKAEYWAQKAADSGDADACALLAQIKITNPVSLDYPQAKVLAEKAAQAGSKEGEVTLAHILVNTQAGKPDYPKAISLLENASEDLENDSAVDAQMLLGLIYANGVGSEELATVANILIRNVTITNVDPRYPILLMGMTDSHLKNIVLENVSVEYRGGLSIVHYGKVMPARRGAEHDICSVPVCLQR